MTKSKAFVLETLRRQGYAEALALQGAAAEMTGTELNAEADYVPDFEAARAKQNMLSRNAGFVCRSSEGRVVRLLQPYDSDVFTQEPEELPAQWGFVWSDDPAHALPFVAISTSPYMAGNCCTEGGEVYRSLYDNNVHAPSVWPEGWKMV